MEDSAEVQEANVIAREVMGRGGDATYMPHLSLMYGDIDDSIKDKIIEGIREDLVGKEFVVDSVSVWSTKVCYDVIIVVASTTDYIYIIYTTYLKGTADQWYEVETIPFSKV